MPTCYAIETVVEAPSNEQGLISGLENVFSNRTTVLESQEEPAGIVSGDPDSGTPEHVKQVKRLDVSENRTDAVDALLAQIDTTPESAWGEVRIHECYHNLQTGAGEQPCPSWEIATDSNGDNAQRGSPPEGVSNGN